MVKAAPVFQGGPSVAANDPHATIRFDLAYAAVSFGLIGGIYLDGWAHNHGRVESFITPWHGVLYSGFFALFAFLLVAVVLARRAGRPWRGALPTGYQPSLVGGFIFLGGGIFDVIWHQLFGVEADVAALLSPSHLILGLGAFLLLGGPLRSAGAEAAAGALPRSGWRFLGPALLSLTSTVALLAFFTQFIHPDMFIWSDRFNGLGDDWEAQSLGVSGILIEAALLTGFLLFALRRWSLPFGSVTLVAGLTTLGIAAMRDTWFVVPAAIAAGTVGDVLILTLRPSMSQVNALRAFAFAFPSCFYAAYFFAVDLTRGIGWSIHLWLGSVILAGVVGLLLSYLIDDSIGTASCDATA